MSLPLPHPALPGPPPPPSPKPPSLIAVTGSRKNVIDVASVFLEACEAALKYVLCGRLVGWGLALSLILGGKSCGGETWRDRRTRGHSETDGTQTVYSKETWPERERDG